MRSYRSVGVFVAGAFALLALYQNCAPQHSITNQSESSTSDDGGLVRVMGDAEGEVSHEITSPVVNSKATSAASCEVQSLKCYRKVYAPNLDDGAGEETLCLKAGSSPCLQVQTHIYNTRTAIEACADCGPQVVLAGGEYNREEFTCWVGSTESNQFAMRATLEDAASVALATCGGVIP